MPLYGDNDPGSPPSVLIGVSKMSATGELSLLRSASPASSFSATDATGDRRYGAFPVAVISVTEETAGTFLVEVRAQETTTRHQVRVTPGLAEQIGGTGTTDSALVEAAFGFLLEREPNTSILRTFSIEQIGDYFPGWSAEVAARVISQGLPKI